MNVHFRLGYHTLNPGQQIVECWADDQFIATIYPSYQAIRIVSKHTHLVAIDPEPPHTTIIAFDQEPPPLPTEPTATEGQP